eukprot:2928958-Prymnesium_polylepis.1
MREARYRAVTEAHDAQAAPPSASAVGWLSSTGSGAEAASREAAAAGREAAAAGAIVPHEATAREAFVAARDAALAW